MPLRTQTYTQHDFGERLVGSLEGIVSDPVGMLGQSRIDAGRPAHTTLDILSASRYPHALIPGYDSDASSLKRKTPHKANPSGTAQQFYGGIVRTSSTSQENVTESSSAEQEAPTKPKKKKKARKGKKAVEDDANEESKRARGRPRLDPQDETAADRRRTQIRLAQRAYRHRKETTISALKQRVNELQSTIEQMNKTFISLHDNIIDAGVTNNHVNIARQLQKATQEFITLAKVAEDSEDEEDAVRTTEINGPSNDSHSGHKQQKTPLDSFSDDAEIEELPLNEGSFYTELNPWENMNNDMISFNVEIAQPEAVSLDVFAEKARAAAAQIFPPVEYPISSPQGKNGSYTYSFQETSFARRLHRRSLENAWRNLTAPNIDPAVINRTFRFTFCFSNRKRMMHRFQELLKRKAGDALENFNIPFFHIGGAGTHFPRIDKDGVPVYPPNMLSPKKALSQDIGPHLWLGQAAETPRPDLPDVQSVLEGIGFGGDWFDSHDVEGYLKTKGIYLDGNSSFVDIDSSVILPRVPTRTQSSNSSLSTSPDENVLRTPSPTLPAYQNDLFTQQEMNELYPAAFVNNPIDVIIPFDPNDKEANMFSTRPQVQISNENVYNQQIWPWGYDGSYYASNATGTEDLFPQLFNPSQSPHYATDFSGASPALTTLDVEKFLENLVEGAACLGRAPGFRKELVENALALSVSEAY